MTRRKDPKIYVAALRKAKAAFSVYAKDETSHRRIEHLKELLTKYMIMGYETERNRLKKRRAKKLESPIRGFYYLVSGRQGEI